MKILLYGIILVSFNAQDARSDVADFEGDLGKVLLNLSESTSSQERLKAVELARDSVPSINPDLLIELLRRASNDSNVDIRRANADLLHFLSNLPPKYRIATSDYLKRIHVVAVRMRNDPDRYVRERVDDAIKRLEASIKSRDD